jgi:NDP-sugar pyrophosphorylase family protein
MAAGEGRRLRPLTERWPKPILPIDGRAVIATLIRELKAAGCEQVTVVTGHLAEQVERLLGDGSGFGLELRYARQPRPDGSADAVSRGLAAGARPPLVVTTADTVFRHGDITRFAAAFETPDTPGAAAVRRSPAGAAVEVEGGLVRRIGGEAAGPFVHAGVWGPARSWCRTWRASAGLPSSSPRRTAGRSPPASRSRPSRLARREI